MHAAQVGYRPIYSGPKPIQPIVGGLYNLCRLLFVDCCISLLRRRERHKVARLKQHLHAAFIKCLPACLHTCMHACKQHVYVLSSMKAWPVPYCFATRACHVQIGHTVIEIHIQANESKGKLDYILC